MKKPVVKGIGTWDIKGVKQVKTPQEAIGLIKKIAYIGHKDTGL